MKTRNTKPKPARDIARELADLRRAYRIAMTESEQKTRALAQAAGDIAEAARVAEAARAAELAVPTFNRVLACGRRWHQAAVVQVAEQAIAELRALPEPPEDVNIWMHNRIDVLVYMHPRVQRAAEARLLLAFSENETAYESEHGVDDARGAELEDIARAAMEADAWEYLNRERKRWSRIEEDL